MNSLIDQPIAAGQKRQWTDPDVLKATKQTALALIALVAISALLGGGAYFLSLWAGHGGLAPLENLLNTKQSLTLTQIVSRIVAPAVGGTTLLIFLGRATVRHHQRRVQQSQAKQKPSLPPPKDMRNDTASAPLPPPPPIDVDASDTDSDNDSGYFSAPESTNS